MTFHHAEPSKGRRNIKKGGSSKAGKESDKNMFRITFSMVIQQFVSLCTAGHFRSHGGKNAGALSEQDSDCATISELEIGGLCN